MGRSGRCPVLAAGDRVQAPRAPEPTAPTAEPASAPRQHPRPAQAALMLPPPGSLSPASGWGMQGTAPGFPSPPLCILFILYIAKHRDSQNKPPPHSSSGWIACKPPPSLPWKHIPEPPGWGAAPAAPASAYRRHAPSLRETTPTTASAEKFSSESAPVPPRAGTAAGCTEPPGTG